MISGEIENNIIRLNSLKVKFGDNPLNNMCEFFSKMTGCPLNKISTLILFILWLVLENNSSLNVWTVSKKLRSFC